MERPPQQIIDYFYKLSDYNPQKRLNAARDLLQNEETLKYKDYVFDRLLKGLSSGKSGARLGFSTVLSVLLHQNPEVLNVDELLALVDEKLSLKVPKKERGANALGQHLVFVAIYSAAVYRSELSKIINRHISLLDEAPHLRLIFADAILLVFTNYKDETKTDILPSNEILKLLELIETIEVSEKKVELHGRFSKELVSQLDDKSYVSFAKKALKKEPWYYNRLILSFGRRSTKTKSKILELLTECPEKTSQTFGAACSLMERLFKLVYHKNQIHDVRIIPEDEQLILDMFPAEGKKKKKDANRTIEIIASVLRFIQTVSNDPEDAEQYGEYASEAQKLAQTSECSQALIDLCLSLNAQKLRLCRTLVLFVMAKEHRLFNTEDVESTIKTITNPENEEMGDGEFKPITEEERQQVLEKWAAEGNDLDNMAADESGAEDGSDDDSMEEMETDDEENAKVDPEVAKKLKSALGRFAFNDSEDDGGQSDVEMNDEEIEELDRALGAALRPIIQKRALKNAGPGKGVQWLQTLLKFKETHEK